MLLSLWVNTVSHVCTNEEEAQESKKRHYFADKVDKVTGNEYIIM